MPYWLIHMMRFLIFLAVVLIPVCCESDPEWHSVGNLDVHTEWMELPAMHGVPLDYYTHSFVLKKKTYRNYSFAWSQNDLLSLWVAYPLCSSYIDKAIDRTEAWSYDPLLGEELSPAPFKGYAGHYARGHQLPSADRMCCRAANEQTFYGSNIMPQLDDHNEGVWNRLESYVRSIAEKADTLYVVTGCVVDGSVERTTDSDGKFITVPVAFYKALLRYGDGGQWDCAAFYTDHRNYGKKNFDLKSLSMSVDELEKKTGMDFFVNLPGKIGQRESAALEARDPASSSVWRLK